MSENTEEQKKWEDLTDEEVDKAFRMIVEKNEFRFRKMQETVLKAMGVTPEMVVEQIKNGEKCYVDGRGALD